MWKLSENRFQKLFLWIPVHSLRSAPSACAVHYDCGCKYFALRLKNDKPMKELPFIIFAQFPGFSSAVLAGIDPGLNQMGTSFKMLKCDHFYLPFHNV
jgi:hypothetical protein